MAAAPVPAPAASTAPAADTASLAVPAALVPPPGLLVLPAELTHRQATACLAMLRNGLRRQHDASMVVVEGSALTTFDTAALAVLLECRREALDAGKTFAVSGLPQALMGLAGLYGVRDVLAPPAASV